MLSRELITCPRCGKQDWVDFGQELCNDCQMDADYPEQHVEPDPNENWTAIKRP